jgi:hypothetical protein
MKKRKITKSRRRLYQTGGSDLQGEWVDGQFYPNPVQTNLIKPTTTTSTTKPAQNTKQAVVFYEANDMFGPDLERITANFNNQYGEGNWAAYPLQGEGVTTGTGTFSKVWDRHYYTPEFLSYIQTEADKYYSNPAVKKRMIIENAYRNSVEGLPANSAEYETIYNKYLQDLKEFENTDDFWKYSDANTTWHEAQKEGYKSKNKLPNTEIAKMYGSYLKDLDPNGKIILMQHGTSKIGNIMASESTRGRFNYQQTPGVVDTFSEVLGEYLPENNNVVCYMGSCFQVDTGKEITKDSGVTTKSQVGEWAGFHNRSKSYGQDQTFDERFFDPYDLSRAGGPFQTSKIDASGNLVTNVTGKFKPKTWSQIMKIANNKITSLDHEIMNELKRISGESILGSGPGGASVEKQKALDNLLKKYKLYDTPHRHQTEQDWENFYNEVLNNREKYFGTVYKKGGIRKKLKKSRPRLYQNGGPTEEPTSWLDRIKKNLAENLFAGYGYEGPDNQRLDNKYQYSTNPIMVLDRLFNTGVLNKSEFENLKEDELSDIGSQLEQQLFRMYLGQKQSDTYPIFSQSEYIPSKGHEEGDVYWSIPKEHQSDVYGISSFPDRLSLEGWDGQGDVLDFLKSKYSGIINKNMVVGDYTRGAGRTDDGQLYLSAYDKFDLNPFPSQVGDMSMGIGSPQNIYDRFNYTHINHDTHPDLFSKDNTGLVVKNDILEKALKLREQQLNWDYNTGQWKEGYTQKYKSGGKVIKKLKKARRKLY